jgi:uncharacterized membrane protein
VSGEERKATGWRVRAPSWPAIWLGAVVLEVAAGSVLVWVAGQHGPALLAAALNLAVCVRFALTLRDGSVPLITRYARCDEAGLPPECEFYTRLLTGIWAAVLLVFAVAHAAAALGLWATRDVSFVQSAALLALFFGEHPLRGWLFPQIGRVRPMRTLRAMRLALGARHAA